jgi:hypothetical protein
MSRPRKYPEELVQRGVRLALESGRPIAHIAADLGMHPETCASGCAKPRLTEIRSAVNSISISSAHARTGAASAAHSRRRGEASSSARGAPA